MNRKTEDPEWLARLAMKLGTLGIILSLIALCLSLTGCATFTEEYWAAKYERMTPAELESARTNGATVWDIYIDSLTNSHLVCLVGHDCYVVQVY